ncbi:hypothetical protein P8452_50118 [Trifolium repens]|nr:hypothetical protein P8452_50118 [Trifolium repens]
MFTFAREILIDRHVLHLSEPLCVKTRICMLFEFYLGFFMNQSLFEFHEGKCQSTRAFGFWTSGRLEEKKTQVMEQINE